MHLSPLHWLFPRELPMTTGYRPHSLHTGRRRGQRKSYCVPVLLEQMEIPWVSSHVSSSYAAAAYVTTMTQRREQQRPIHPHSHPTPATF